MPRPDFDLETYWQKARRHIEKHMQPVDLILHVSPSARVGLHGDGTILREESDGSIVVRVNVDSFDAATSYVLSLGADVTILQPLVVRQAVASAAQAIAEKYTQLQLLTTLLS